MITILWTEQETTPREDGGDYLTTSFRTLALDIATSQQRDVVAEHPEHPVEEGSAVNDHTIPAPRRVSVEVSVSNAVSNEVRFDGASRRGVGVGDGLEARVVGVDSAEDRATDTLELLSELCESGAEVEVNGLPYGDLDGYQIDSVSSGQDTTTGMGTLVATISFSKRRTVSVSEVEAPAPMVERGRPNTDRGSSSTTEGEDGDAVSDNDPRDRSSDLYNLLGLGD